MTTDLRDAHELTSDDDQLLQRAVGRQIRKLRHAQNLTVADLSRASTVSLAMISKIENGQTSASLNTLERIAGALSTSISSLFVQYEEHRDVSYVPAGQGLEIERRGTRAGHQYQLLGHGVRGEIALEPYLVTLTDAAESFPWFQHSGVEFLYILEGEMTYRIGDNLYDLVTGDSLFFDPLALHGPDTLTTLPVKFLAIIGYERKA